MNSWTGSASGNWEDASWSLGILPGAGQTILITNANWKAVAIGTNTALNFPQSLTVDSITVSSPADTSNTLLLNYAGINNPLSANSLTVASNSAVMMNGSALQVSNLITVNGTFTEDMFSVVTNLSLDVETIGAGGFNLNSGLLISGFGEDIGLKFPSTFVQAGGTNHAVGVRVYPNSEYDLNGGLLDGVIILRPQATFRQQGGVVDNSTNSANLTSVDGNFLQSGGMFIGPTNSGMYLPGYFFLHQGTASGSALQTGGTNVQNNLNLGNQTAAENQDNGQAPPYGGTYTLSNGVVVTSGTIVAANGTMEQAGGTHIVNGTLNLQGSLYYAFSVINETTPAVYRLDGGTLSAQEELVGVAANFSQAGGTNHVADTISFAQPSNPIGASGRGQYSLNNGELAASNILVLGGQLNQSGGDLVVTNQLLLQNTTFQQTGGTLKQSGLLSLLSANWYPASGSQQPGQLKLADGGSDSLGLPASACVLQFADSSGVAWSGGVLQILNWSGSIYGGGNQRIIFGNGAGALTGQQLSQITFANPIGLASGNYPARILATGEMVPNTGSALPVALSLASQSNSSVRIVIGGQIGSNYIIQTSTDLVHWVPWTTQLDSTGTIGVNDSTASAPTRFYRVIQMP
ncbi:MAG TPA: hypothetical protein VH597_08490 [Verrucomicrobiae bacterium]|nr:hypothetical protein [Verrucomicrobiae bacterium]